MVSGGAQTAFDVWYEWDKTLYADDEPFLKLLDYLRTVDIQKDFS